MTCLSGYVLLLSGCWLKESAPGSYDSGMTEPVYDTDVVDTGESLIDPDLGDTGDSGMSKIDSGSTDTDCCYDSDGLDSDSGGGWNTDTGDTASTEDGVSSIYFSDIATTSYGTTCGIAESNELVCWGYVEGWDIGVPPEGEFAQVSVGDFGCAVTTENILHFWAYEFEDVPESEYIQCDAGFEHVCAVNTSQEVECWATGYGDKGQSDPPEESGFVQVSGGDWDSCALDTSGSITCWGYGYGEDFPGENTYVKVSVGVRHACAITDEGEILCIGDDASGESTPIEASYIDVSAGYDNSCGVTTAGAVLCWGRDNFGESTPPTEGSFTRVVTGATHTCALRDDSKVVCWGYDSVGQASPP
jgi:alpha-tubulin suppressor-like RCC1 family protein